MTRQARIVRWVVVVAFLAAGAAAAGLLWTGGEAPSRVETARGERVELYGRGVYRYDTVFMGAGNRGVDAVVLLFALPLLLGAAFRYRQGCRRGGMILLGVLGDVLYVYATMALGAAYNPLFLVYVALFGLGMYSFVTLFDALRTQPPPDELLQRLPCQGLSGFLLVGGALTLFVWIAPLITSLIAARPPQLLDHYATMVTYALDLAVITPATFLAAVAVSRRRWTGYLLATTLLVLLALLLPQIIAQTVFQLGAGISFTTGQLVGPIAGFGVLGAIAIGLLMTIGVRIGGATSPRRDPR